MKQETNNATFEHYLFNPRSLPTTFPIVLSEYKEPYTGANYFSAIHLHDTLEFGYCHEGEGVFITRDKIIRFTSGDMIVVNYREAHVAQNNGVGESIMSWVHLDPHRLCPPYIENNWYTDYAPFYGPNFENVIPGENNPFIISLLRRLIEELQRREREYSSYVRFLVASIMIELHRYHKPDWACAVSNKSNHSAHQKINPALAILRTTISSPVSVKLLAEKCCMAETTFRRVFKKTVGMTAKEYQLKMRMLSASSLLRSSEKSVVEIAHLVGYPSASIFGRIFKQHMHINPREYRKQYQKR